MKSTLIVTISSLILLSACASQPAPTEPTPHALVLTTDFSLKDGAVSAMKGVAFGVSPQLVISDLTHEVEPFNIWEAAYRLRQTYKYWPAGTVFVTVVDPGVGSKRKSVVVRTKTGHYFVGPDNGHLTLVLEEAGLDRAIDINESQQRLKGSDESYTFHGRDLYVYVGARLAAGRVQMDDLGSPLTVDLVRLSYQPPTVQDGKILGNIPVLDPNYGNVWTNIPKSLVNAQFKSVKQLRVEIFNGKQKVFDQRLSVADTFAGVEKGKPLLYFNSLLNVAVALNQGDFAKKHKVKPGPDWTLRLSQ